MAKRYTGNIISATPQIPSSNYGDTPAPGVWSMNEVKGLVEAGLWPNSANVSPSNFIENVFSTFLYTGNGTSGTSTQTINNGIDLANQGGLTWTKNRDQADSHYLIGSDSNFASTLTSNSSGSYGGASNIFEGVSSTGYTVKGDFGGNNTNNEDYVSWTLRKKARLFDIVSYDGNSTSGHTISHNLGSVPGCIMVKCTSTSSTNWVVYHRAADASAPETKYMVLNSENQAFTSSSYWNNTAPTATEFTVGNSSLVNSSTRSYVAYLFAHNNGDGGFGPNGDADVIQCGSYTGNGSSDGPEVDIGFEVQWLLIKRSNATGTWSMVDIMRGMSRSKNEARIQNRLRAQSNVAENNTEALIPTPTGWKVNSSSLDYNTSGSNYTYIAIRRGPQAVPTTATDVFALQANNYGDTITTGFVPDMMIDANPSGGGNRFIASRLTGSKSQMYSNSNAAETTSDDYPYWDNPTGTIKNLYGSNRFSWVWGRAPSFFDAVAYTGNATAGNAISHNLGVVPEMMWVKRRDTTGSWVVYHKDADATAPEDYYLKLESQDPAADLVGAWNDTAPTATEFTLGNWSQVNNTNDYIAYLFASLDGISKLGSFNPPSSGGLDIDCGFTNGARFILIKRTDAPNTSAWFLFDSVRGIGTGADPYLALNTNNAQDSSYDAINTYSAGFSIPSTAFGSIFSSLTTANYIFYAIA